MCGCWTRARHIHQPEARTSVWDSNLIASRQCVDDVGVTWRALCDRPHEASTAGPNQNSQRLVSSGVAVLGADWLGGRDSNPDTVVQSPTEMIRLLAEVSDFLGFSLPILRMRVVTSGHFVRTVSHSLHTA